MATMIKSISFQNFYNYYGDLESNIYNLSEGINIINADNNMGKSKFFNGILWILTGSVYDSDKKQYVSATNSLLLMASGKAKHEEVNFKMSVRIIIVENETEYTITKSVSFFNEFGELKHENEKLDVIERFKNQTIPILDISKKNEVIRKVIPTELINYALLQGESMEKLVDLSSHSGLSSTIEALAEISDLVSICKINSELTKKAKVLLNLKERENDKNLIDVNNKIDEKEKLERYIDDVKEKISQYQGELSAARNKKDELEALQLNATKREKFRGIKEIIEREIEFLKSQKSEKEKNITSMLFSGNNPWLLLGLEHEVIDFSSRRDKWVTEKATLNISKNPSLLLLPEGSPDVPSLKRMLQNDFCEVCGRPVERGSDAWKHIESVMNRPQDTGKVTKNDFSTFYSNIQTSTGSLYNYIPEINKLINEYRDDLNLLDQKITQKQQELENAKLEFINAGGEGHTDKETISSYSLAERNEIKYKKLVDDSKELIARWEKRLKQIDAEYTIENGTDEVKNYRDFRDMMIIIEEIFNQTKERIYDEIIKSLEENANQKYSELTFGNLTSGGRLFFEKQDDATVQVSIKDKFNGEMTGLGTGFQRMKQLSIVMAIISSKIGSKQFQYPFISDAPFSEFGDNFINNFFQVAPRVFKQCIILIKELYDPNDRLFLNSFGKKILNEMVNGKIKGTFYVNVIKEAADSTNLVTNNICYKN